MKNSYLPVSTNSFNEEGASLEVPRLSVSSGSASGPIAAGDGAVPPGRDLQYNTIGILPTIKAKSRNTLLMEMKGTKMDFFGTYRPGPVFQRRLVPRPWVEKMFLLNQNHTSS